MTRFDVALVILMVLLWGSFVAATLYKRRQRRQRRAVSAVVRMQAEIMGAPDSSRLMRDADSGLFVEGERDLFEEGEKPRR